MKTFHPTTVLKRDVFSESHLGTLDGAPDEQVVHRSIAKTPLWSRPLAIVLMRREIRAMRTIGEMQNLPRLIDWDGKGLYRTWIGGTPLHLGRPSDPLWYRQAHHMLRELRRRGMTHNDLAKPQNWLIAADGRPGLIDFQLASVHRRRGAFFRWMAYEDFRHLLKQKRAFAPDLLTPTGRRILARRSLPSRIWMATGKRVYNFVTRRLFNWSDGEGTRDRIEREGKTIEAAFRALPDVSDVALTVFSLPARGVGLYAFVEGPAPAPARLKAVAVKHGVEYVQPVEAFPRRPDGRVREDILKLVAMNQVTELNDLVAREPQLRDVVRALSDGRLNFGDRRVIQQEALETN